MLLYLQLFDSFFVIQRPVIKMALIILATLCVLITDDVSDRWAFGQVQIDRIDRVSLIERNGIKDTAGTLEHQFYCCTEHLQLFFVVNVHVVSMP